MDTATEEPTKSSASDSANKKEECETVEESAESKGNTDESNAKETKKAGESSKEESAVGASKESNIWWFYQLESTVRELLATLESR